MREGWKQRSEASENAGQDGGCGDLHRRRFDLDVASRRVAGLREDAFPMFPIIRMGAAAEAAVRLDEQMFALSVVPAHSLLSSVPAG
jgi:hypothetical protein